MKDFKKLEIWQKALAMSVKIYEITASFPEEERFGIISQMRRCSVSIPSNIAEGAGRKSDNENSRFIEYSIASSFELETQLILSEKLGFINHTNLIEITEELGELQRQMTKFQKVLYS